MTPAPPAATLVAAVQTNCDIADARHAADLPLCSYLLQMREYYRWRHGLPLGAALPRDAVGAWIAQREHEWSRLETHDFVPLPAAPPAPAVAPFDLDAAQAQLAPAGLAYGAALAGRDRPAFFLAELTSLDERDDGLWLQRCGREYARGLYAPPAALLGRTIVLRRESLARWVWEQYEAFAVRRPQGAFKAVVDAYGLDRDFHAALPRLLDEQAETLVLHEVGEHRAGRRLDPGWAALRLALDDRRTDLQLRAVRDLIADLRTTLPTLLAHENANALHFWFAAFDGLRAALCPTLQAAYAAWCRGDGAQALRCVCRRGGDHFERLADELLTLHARHGDAVGAPIAARLAEPRTVHRG